VHVYLQTVYKFTADPSVRKLIDNPGMVCAFQWIREVEGLDFEHRKQRSSI